MIVILVLVLLSAHGLAQELNLKFFNHPDQHLLFKDLTKKYGYPFESYSFTTKDDFELQIYRIKHGRFNNVSTYQTPFLLVHAMLGSAENFLTAGAYKGLAYYLADRGFDVWVANLRGNLIATKHKYYNQFDQRFWNHSWHEISVIDIAQHVDFVLDKTNKKELYYVGHSQACTCYFVLTSMLPEYNKKIKMSFLLGAPVLMDQINYPIVKTLSRFHYYFYEMIKAFNLNGFMGNCKTLVDILPMFCSEMSFGAAICRQIMTFLDSGDNIRKKATQNIVSSSPSGASLFNSIHYMQIIDSGEFKQFDYGKHQNMKAYGQPKPPLYDLTKCTAPIVVFTSPYDLTAPISQFDTLNKSVNLYKKVVIPKYFHMDYVFAGNIHTLVNKPLVEIAYEMENRSSIN